MLGRMRERLTDAVFPRGVDRRGIAVLSTGHLAADLFQGSVPALLPFLIADRGYSYAAAGALFLMASLGSSIVQPLLGIYSDRVRAGWLMSAGLLLAGIGLALSGLASSYAGTAAALLVGGIGVAAFHPEAVRFASHVSAARRGAGMSVFAVGGTAGFALGPILMTPVAVVLGPGGTPIVGAVIVAAGGAVLWNTRYLEKFRPRDPAVRLAGQASSNQWLPFGLASGSATARVVVGFGLQYAVPLWVVAELASTAAHGNAAVATMLIAGAFGTLIGGRLADRFGFRPVVVWSLALGVPLAVALPFANEWTLFPLMAALGLVEGANFYPLIVIAQNALPGYLGFAAGVVLGLGIGIGAGVVALLGVLGDAAGMTAVIWAIAGFAGLAYVLAAGLPAERRGARAETEAGEPVASVST
jgi:FSR family fosmidomycin resistance protein-like MFS transporter